MSKDLMDTAIGGEQTQYESEHNDVIPHNKSGGQMGQASTAVDSKPEVQAQETKERGEKTAENIRYGQGISEQGMAGMTQGNSGEANDGGFGRLAGKEEEGSAKGERKAAGYGGDKDMDRNIGA